jgi:hypothetical protein
VTGSHGEAIELGARIRRAPRHHAVAVLAVVVEGAGAVVAVQVTAERAHEDGDVTVIGGHPRAVVRASIAPAHGHPADQLERRLAIARRDVAALVLVGRVDTLRDADLADAASGGIGKGVLEVPVRGHPAEAVAQERRIVIDVHRRAGEGGGREHGRRNNRGDAKRRDLRPSAVHLHVPYNRPSNLQCVGAAIGP